MLVIQVENLNRTTYKELYVKDRKRLATATSVNFINENYLVVTNLVAMKMYLYYFDYKKSEAKLIDEIDTIHNGKLSVTDLMDFNGKDLLVTSNCDNGSQSLYKLEKNKLKHLKDINNPQSTNGFCHGIRFDPYHPNTICATIFKNCCVNFINYETNELIYQISYDECYRPKDLTFYDKNKIVVLYTNSRIKQENTNENFISKLIFYDVDIENKNHSILLEYNIENSHGDSILFYKNIFFVNNQIIDKINVLHFKNNNLIPLTEITGLSMPHGLSIEPKNNLLAITNYGNNTVMITKLPDDIVKLYKN